MTTELKEKAYKLAENFRYSLIAKVYMEKGYQKGYEQCKKEIVEAFKNKYDLTTSIDDFCNGVAEELEE